MDPVRNPYAPGAGQRPPELTGRDREIGRFEVLLERVARGRPERSMVLTGLRGVGKTVLLNTFRSMALQRLWGTGKLEARPDQSIRRPVTGSLHMAVRELAPRHRGRTDCAPDPWHRTLWPDLARTLDLARKRYRRVAEAGDPHRSRDWLRRAR